MAEWSTETPAHVDTWFSLFRLGQIRKTFKPSAKIKMSELTFYNPTASSDLLKQEATLIADTIDRVFKSWGAELEPNITQSIALNEMIATLLDKDKTVFELAEVNNVNYFFMDEIRKTDES